MRARVGCTGYRLGHVVVGVALAGGTLTHSRAGHADDRTAAQSILKAIDPASNGAARQAIDALERGTRMRGAGDEAHARLAEGLALEWAELASDRERALAAEKEAHASEVAAIDAEARVERERALLEEAIARGGRLRAELAKLTAKGGSFAGKEHPTTFAGGATPPKPSPAHGSKGSPSPPPAPHVDADAPTQNGAHREGAR